MLSPGTGAGTRECGAQVYFAIAKPPNTHTPANPEDAGIINQHGLNRKVCDSAYICYQLQPTHFFGPQHIFDSVKASLERLQLDYIDVLQCKLDCVYCTYVTSIHKCSLRPSV